MKEPVNERLIRELGLGPVWRLRSRAAGGESALSESPGATTHQGEHAVHEAPMTSSAAAVGEAPAAASANSPAAEDDRAARIAAMEWDALESSVAACTACGLCKSRNNTVFGVGDRQAQWMLVGEAPGAEEDARGEPFVGQAGRLLDNMLAAIDLKRGANVYIANVLKCRPPNNRNPEPNEVSQCSPYLIRQIGLLRPRLIVAMGRFAAQTLLDSDASISSMRGKVYRYQGVPTVVTYHPAYLLRSLPDKAKAWEDLLFAVRTMRGLD